jgi:hypothetical protein
VRRSPRDRSPKRDDLHAQTPAIAPRIERSGRDTREDGQKADILLTGLMDFCLDALAARLTILRS